MSCDITWCKVDGPHVGLHFALVALLHDVSVAVRTVGGPVGGPVEVTVTAYEPGTSRAAGTPPTVLTPPQARSLGQTIAGRDAELSRALIAAADLAESGGAR